MSKLSLAAFAVALFAGVSTVVADKDDNTQLLSQISGYRNWTAVNGEPVKVEVPAGFSIAETAA